MNDNPDRCPHKNRVDRVEEVDGWATPYADACMLCEGEPAGARYKVVALEEEATAEEPEEHKEEKAEPHEPAPLDRLDGLLILEAGLARAQASISAAQADALMADVSRFHDGVVYAVTASISSALRLIIMAREMEERAG